MRLISAKTILGLSALLLTAACTDEQVENPADGARPIAFTPAAETRAAVDGTTLPGDFKVWGWYGESTGNIDKNVFNGTIIKAPSWTYDQLRLLRNGSRCRGLDDGNRYAHIVQSYQR